MAKKPPPKKAAKKAADDKGAKGKFPFPPKKSKKK